MKGLVLLGEGQGEEKSLPILVNRLLKEKDTEQLLYVDKNPLRVSNALGLVKWDKEKNALNHEKWIHYLQLAARRPNTAGVLAFFDGDAKHFPPGSTTAFCVATAAKTMATIALSAGAGKTFSLAIVFACVEYETWLIAGAESLIGKKFPDDRPGLPSSTPIPTGNPESHGKGWLRKYMSNYRPTLDQAPLTELVDLNLVRAKKLRSFTRLEHALDQLLTATRASSHICTPSNSP